MLPESVAYIHFQDTRNKLATILSDVAEVAQARKEMVFSDEATGDAFGGPVLTKRPLAEVLRQRAKTVAATTPFRVAVVGEFSRGKSTLINALLERDILTSDFRPNTAARTVLRYGEPERFRVNFVKELGRSAIEVLTNDLKNDLSRYTSDAAVNSDYRTLLKGDKKSLAEEIAEVEVWSSSNFLKAKQLEIVDTPGLGSVFQAHKAVTYEVIPTVDATLFLVQADPGLGENEILFLKYVREYVNQIFFVLTKKDIARSSDELQGMLEFVRATIEENVELKVENLFPISALKILQGDEKDSGFHEFLPALEGFLVRSKGVGRLQAPYDLAMTHWSRLYDAVSDDIAALGQSLDDLRNELNRLLKDEKKIERTRDKLLKQVDDQIEELCGIATDGMGDYLPRLIQQEVEVAIDGLDSVQKLGKAGDYLQPVMKDVVLKWLGQKEQRFQSSAERLRHRVEQDLQDILDTIQSKETQIGSGIKAEVTTPQAIKGLWSEVGSLVGKAGISGGVGFVAGVGAMGIVAATMGITSVAAFPPLLALIPIVTIIAPITKELFDFKANLRKRIKKELLQPVSGNTVNAYQAIVDGYEKDGQHQAGVRNVVENTFRKWGSQLKEGISETVTNNLDARLTLLRRQIREKESGQQNQEQELAKYTQQKQDLDSLKSRLDQVLKTISELSEGHTEIEGFAVVDAESAREKLEPIGEKKAQARRKSEPSRKPTGKSRVKK